MGTSGSSPCAISSRTKSSPTITTSTTATTMHPVTAVLATAAGACIQKKSWPRRKRQQRRKRNRLDANPESSQQRQILIVASKRIGDGLEFGIVLQQGIRRLYPL